MKSVRNIILILLAAAAVGGYVIIKPYYDFLTNTLQISPLKTLFFDNSVKTISGTVNILVLGIAGGTHDGPNLSDSIVVLHYNFDTDHLDTIGIPRDIWSGTLKDKINSAYAYGETKQEDGGLKLAKAEVGSIIGTPIQYSIVISFSKYKELIDYIGGIDVPVENSFVDNEFPIEGKENDLCGGDSNYRCRYETIRFTKGQTYMDSTTALKFVRSRHSEGDEGSDFARSKRQQLVVAAIKDKIVKIIKTYDLDKIKSLYAKTDSLVNRDVTNQQLVTIGKDIVFSKKFRLKNFVLPEKLFKVPNYSDYNGMYVLIPATNWNDIHSFVTCVMDKEDEKVCTSLVNQGKENK